MSANGTSSGGEMQRALETGASWMAVNFLALSMPGVLLSTLVVVLSVTPGLIDGEFKWFILNLAAVDLFASLVYLCQGVNFLFPDYQYLSCSWQYMLLFYGIYSSTFALLPISIHRFINMHYPQHGNVFKPHTILALCLLCDGIAAVQVAPYLYLLDDWTAETVSGVCLASETSEKADWVSLTHALNYALVGLAVSGAMLLNGSVYRKVHNHLAIVIDLNDERRLNETRRIVLTTMLQVLVPTLCQLPTIAVSVAIERTHSTEHARMLSRMRYVAPLTSLIGVNATADCLLVIAMLPAYRQAVRNVIAALRHCQLGPNHGAPVDSPPTATVMPVALHNTWI